MGYRHQTAFPSPDHIARQFERAITSLVNWFREHP
jgi:hypothetical protein